MLDITFWDLRGARPRTIQGGFKQGLYGQAEAQGGPGPGPYGRLQAGAIRATGGAGGARPRTIQRGQRRSSSRRSSSRGRRRRRKEEEGEAEG